MKLGRRLQQARVPFRKNRGDLVVIFFSREIVKARIGLEERGIEWRLLPIVWLQAKLAIRDERFLRIERA